MLETRFVDQITTDNGNIQKRIITDCLSKVCLFCNFLALLRNRLTSVGVHVLEFISESSFSLYSIFSGRLQPIPASHMLCLEIAFRTAQKQLLLKTLD